MDKMLLAMFFSFAFVITLIRLRRRPPGLAEAGALPQIEGKVDALLQKAGIRYDPAANLPPGVPEALRQGKKIEAIKLYRGATGAGLKEAKDFIEGLGAFHIQQKLDALLQSAGIAYKPLPVSAFRPKPSASGAKASSGSGDMTEVRSLLQAGNMIGAIKRYREATGVGLKEAKDAVEEMKRNGV